MNRLLIHDAKILIESIAVALEATNPDIEAIRKMLKEADELLAQACRPETALPTELCALPQDNAIYGVYTISSAPLLVLIERIGHRVTSLRWSIGSLPNKEN
jgi:hypothetical protein